MKTRIQLAVLLLVIPDIISRENRYCLLPSCPDRSHTRCVFQSNKYADTCQDPYAHNITEDESMIIVHFHNYKRWPTLSEAVPPYALEWDKELADIAQGWAHQCMGVADTCRNVRRFKVTQRIYTGEIVSLYSEPLIITAMVEWHDLESREPPILNHVSLEEATLVRDHARPWGNANRIGCGKVRTYKNHRFRLYFVCNYGYTS